MKALTFDDAKKILSQIKQGEWVSNACREWDFKPQSGTVYRLSRNGLSLWVANGIGFLRISGDRCDDKFIKIPFYLQVYLWFWGVRKFVKSEIKRFNNADAERDYNDLSSKL